MIESKVVLDDFEIINGFYVYYNKKSLRFVVQKNTGDIVESVVFESKSEDKAKAWCLEN